MAGGLSVLPAGYYLWGSTLNLEWMRCIVMIDRGQLNDWAFRLKWFKIHSLIVTIWLSTNIGMIDCSDKNMIASLYSELAQAAMAKSYSILGDRGLAADVTQEVFIKLWQKGNTFANKKAVYSWIYRSCHNRCIDFWRSASTRYESSNETALAFQIDESLQLDEMMIQKQHLEQIFKKLNKKEAEILGFIVLDQMTQDEVAEIIGVSRKTVVRMVAKIKKKLNPKAAGQNDG